MNSARSEDETSQPGALASLAHNPSSEFDNMCGHKVTSSGLPTTYAPTGYEGSQSSTMPHDSMCHGELSYPERVPSYSASGYPMPHSSSPSDIEGMGCFGAIHGGSWDPPDTWHYAAYN